MKKLVIFLAVFIIGMGYVQYQQHKTIDVMLEIIDINLDTMEVLNARSVEQDALIKQLHGIDHEAKEKVLFGHDVGYRINY